MRHDMTRFLTIVGAVAFLALPAGTPAVACPAHNHTASAEATSIDLAAAAKKALTPAVQQEKADEQKIAPAK
jgi:hypothetical protein